MRGNPALFAIKVRKLVASPFAFLRGAPRVFYEALEQAPELAGGPPGEGALVGDSHLENFGAYRARSRRDGPKGKRRARVVFDVNDFDDACLGPHRLDLVRLATSVLLAARVHGAPGDVTLDLLQRLFEGYSRGVNAEPIGPAPGCVARLVRRVETRSERDFLRTRTTGRRDAQRFTLGERYLPLEAHVRDALPRALERYSAGLPASERLEPAELELCDAALRVAGTGSLGCLRVAALVRGRQARGWLFDLKAESRAPSPRRLATVHGENPADRVLSAYMACLARLPARLGTTRLLGQDMLVRQLTPQEDKLDVAALAPRDLLDLTPYAGALLGRAHARGALRPGPTHTQADRDALAEHASVLAGLHLTAFLAYAARARETARRA